MPELPEVETVRQGLLTSILNKTIQHITVRRWKLRYDIPRQIEDLIGHKIINIRRRAKYLLIDFDHSKVMLSHLGMSGRYTLFPPDEGDVTLPATVNGGQHSRFGHHTGFAGKHDHVEIVFDDGTVAVYTDPRRFGFIDVFERDEEQQHPRLISLGPEPFEQWDAYDFAQRIKNSQRAIKLLLLEQSNVVGVGNIYACEALHRSQISPQQPGSSLVTLAGKPKKKLSTLVDEVKQVLLEAIASGGSSLNDFTNTDGSLGYFSHEFQVYGREDEPCLREGCYGVIERITQGQRSTFLCPRCQRRS